MGELWFASYYTDIYAQMFDSSGNKRGEEFMVNTYTQSHQQAPAIAIDADGNFILHGRVMIKMVKMAAFLLNDMIKTEPRSAASPSQYLYKG